MTRVISVRLPPDWEGRVTPGKARAWVSAWLASPVVLVAEPPATGGYKVNLRLSAAQIAELRKHSKRDTSAAIRGILALHLAQKPPVQHKRGFLWLVGGVITGSFLLLLTFTGVGPAKGRQP